MKIYLTALATSSIILFGGCKKQEKARFNDHGSNEQMQMEFNVEVDPDSNQVVLFIDGEEQVIELGEFMTDMEFNELDGEMKITIVGMGDGEHSFHQLKGMHGDGGEWHTKMDFDMDMHGNPEMQHRIIERHGNQEGAMQEMHDRMMELHGNHNGAMQEVRDRMMELHGNHKGEMQEVRDRMMELHGAPQEVREMMIMRGGPGMIGINMMPQLHGIDEQRELHFIEEIGTLHEVSRHLDSPEAVSLLGIKMIRDGLEAEARLEALGKIVDETPRASAARNAALIATIDTYNELDREEDAAAAMIELVLSNSVWNED